MRLDKHPTKTAKRELTEKLKALKDAGKMIYKQYMEIKPQSEFISHLYAHPKVNKDPEDTC